MNEYTDPGPFGADTDDAVAALMDGELAGFAADQGLDLATVREALEGWSGLAARRSLLEQGGAALREPTELDDVLATGQGHGDSRCELVECLLRDRREA